MKKLEQFLPKAATKAAKLIKLAAFVFPTTVLIKKGEGGQWLSGLHEGGQHAIWLGEGGQERRHSRCSRRASACAGSARSLGSALALPAPDARAGGKEERLGFRRLAKHGRADATEREIGNNEAAGLSVGAALVSSRRR
jgi:hypothetical protein